MAAETGFLIDGTVYEVPTLDSLTMSERRVMWDLSEVTQEDFVRADEESADEFESRVSKLMRHPGFMQALMQIAYQRGNPDAKAARARLVIEQTNYFEAVAAMSTDDEEADEEVPLASTSEPDRSSVSGSLDNENSTKPTSEPGGSDSAISLAEQAALLSPTTASRSDTSSLSAREISAA